MTGSQGLVFILGRGAAWAAFLFADIGKIVLFLSIKTYFFAILDAKGGQMVFDGV